MKKRQKEFYDTRFALTSRGTIKLKCSPILFYDTRLIKTMLRAIGTFSIDGALEVGCGQGTDAILISKYAKNVVAIDISINALRAAKALSRMNDVSKEISFVAGDAQNLPFQDRIFELVFCKDLLHHVPNSMLALSEMRRAAKIKGSVAAIEANAYNPQMILIGLIYFSIDKGVFQNTKAELVRIFQKAGFSSVDFKKTEFLPRHLLFEYRSPLCSPIISGSPLVLRILSEIEERMQNLTLVRNLQNYTIVHSTREN